MQYCAVRGTELSPIGENFRIACDQFSRNLGGGLVSDPRAGFMADLGVGLLAGLVAGIIAAVQSQWLRWEAARSLLALCGILP